MKYLKNENILEKEIEEITYVYNMNNDKCYQMEELSKIIWECIGDKEVEDIINQIVNKFEVEVGMVQEDVYSFVEELVENELIYKK